MSHAAVHHAITTIKRSEGRSATARIAYVCRSVVHDERTGETHRYRDTERELGAVQVIGFDGTPAELANQLEAGEKRRDGQVGRSTILALPHELDEAAQARVVRAFQEHNLDRYGCASVSVVHRKPGNCHAHIVESTRRRDGTKITELSDKRTSSREVEHRRQAWADLVNAELELAAPSAEKVDPRGIRRRALAGEIDQETPRVPHLGPAQHAVLRATRSNAKRLRVPQWAAERVSEAAAAKTMTQRLRELAKLTERQLARAEAVRQAALRKARQAAAGLSRPRPQRAGPSLDD